MLVRGTGDLLESKDEESILKERHNLDLRSNRGEKYMLINRVKKKRRGSHSSAKRLKKPPVVKLAKKRDKKRGERSKRNFAKSPLEGEGHWQADLFSVGGRSPK